jgi:hypothetical protein
MINKSAGAESVQIRPTVTHFLSAAVVNSDEVTSKICTIQGRKKWMIRCGQAIPTLLPCPTMLQMWKKFFMDRQWGIPALAVQFNYTKNCVKPRISQMCTEWYTHVYTYSHWQEHMPLLLEYQQATRLRKMHYEHSSSTCARKFKSIPLLSLHSVDCWCWCSRTLTSHHFCWNLLSFKPPSRSVLARCHACSQCCLVIQQTTQAS